MARSPAVCSHLRGWMRYVWPAPASVLGLLAAAAALACGATARVVDGVLEVASGRLNAAESGGWAGLGFVAITLGHVVLGTSHDVLADLRAHEHEHVRQYERWGVLFFAAYVSASALEWLSGRNPYWHNHFECQARAAQCASDARKASAGVSQGPPCAVVAPLRRGQTQDGAGQRQATQR